MSILGSAVIDLGTNSPQTISGLPARYIPLGFIFADEVSPGAISCDVSAGGTALLGHTASGLGYCGSKPSIIPLQTGDVTVTHTGALQPGNSVTVSVVGVAVP